MEEELFTTAAAADLLAESLPEKSAEQWGLWLRNNRNQSRKAIYRVQAQQLGRVAVYTRDELARFINFEKQRQLGSYKLTGRAAEVIRAYGIGEAGGSTTGRKFEVSAVNLQVDEATGKPYIALILSDPLMIYRIEIGSAKALGHELLELAKAGERAANVG